MSLPVPASSRHPGVPGDTLKQVWDNQGTMASGSVELASTESTLPSTNSSLPSPLILAEGLHSWNRLQVVAQAEDCSDLQPPGAAGSP